MWADQPTFYDLLHHLFLKAHHNIEHVPAAENRQQSQQQAPWVSPQAGRWLSCTSDRDTDTPSLHVAADIIFLWAHQCRKLRVCAATPRAVLLLTCCAATFPAPA